MAKQTRREFLRSTGTIAATAALGSIYPIEAFGKSDTDSRPNILLLFPDQHRFDWTGMNNALPVRTPNLDKLAARGVRFTNAVTPSPLCAPARSCLASGKEYDKCRVGGNGANYPLDQVTFYTLLRDSGYHVMGCGKFDLQKGSNNWGIDGQSLIKEWGFNAGIDSAGKQAAMTGADTPKDPYMAYLEKRGLRMVHVEDYKKRSQIGESAAFPSPLPDDAYTDNWVGQNGIDLIGRAPKGKPWFLQVNFPGPHDPWDATKNMLAQYSDVDFPQPNKNTQFKNEEHVAVRRNYSAMVTNVDRWIGIYLDELKKRGELKNTIVIYSSDHGEMLGDHNRWNKSVPFQPSVGVPLVVAGPTVRKGFVCATPTSAMDIAATCLEIAGAKPAPEMTSKSFMPVLKGDTDKHRDYVYSGLRKWRMVYDGQYKLIRGFEDDGSDVLLFDMKNDPLENNNISAANPKIVERLSGLLKKK